MEKEKLKIILDTDNGDDIDDLITLYFILHHPQVEVVGIICSYMNAALRTKQIEHTLKLFKRTDIPVFAGKSKPLAGLHPRALDDVYCQYSEEIGTAPEFYDDGEKAVIFLINKARELGDKLTILEVAPQTTLAAAIARDRDAFKDTRIIMMAGSFYTNNTEWNTECDYESARIVLESGLDLTYVGNNVTLETELKDPRFENLFLANYTDPRFAYLSKCSNMWVNFSKRHIVLHDPLTFLTLIDDKLVKFNEERITLELNESKTRAYTRIKDDSPYIAKVAAAVDIERMKKHTLDLFKGVK